MAGCLDAARVFLDEVPEAAFIEKLKLGPASADQIDPGTYVGHNVISFGRYPESADTRWSAFEARPDGKVGISKKVTPPRLGRRRG